MHFLFDCFNFMPTFILNLFLRIARAIYGKLFFRRILLSVVHCIIIFIILDIIFPFRPQIHYSQIIVAADGTVMHALLAKDDKWRMKIEADDISPAMRRAFTAKEDKWYYWHLGVNPVAIVRAAVNNIIQGKTTSGASTITMQTARLLEPKERSIRNKIIEIFRALQLEVHYDKEEILEMYLALVPYGGNIEGIKSAAFLYFGVMPAKLSPAQITTLTVIPNRPTSLALGKSNNSIIEARNRWLRIFAESNIFSESETRNAIAEPLDVIRRNLPEIARHLALRLARQYSDKSVIHSSIVPAVQRKIQNLCFNYSRVKALSGIFNAAVIVINNGTGKVEAYIGNSDFYDTAHQGQVDGVRAVRSPGSTLKPLMYAMALDRGIITPKSVITDVPVNFDGFAPENFNRKYNGLITAEKSLAFSLNVPAVKLMNELRPEIVIAKLAQAGFRRIAADKRNLGLSVALGGCGASLEELAALYAAFANGGIYRPPQYINDASTDSAQIISAQAAYMLSEILTQPTRPDLPYNAESSLRLPKIAWKTGTSYGRRDAWSIGFNKRYTIGVWLGNFIGTGTPDITGADAATPLLFAIFNSLEYAGSNEWFAPPKGLDFRYVCSETGHLPADFCHNLTMDYYIPGVSSNKHCEHRKKVFISPDSSVSYCGECLPENGYVKADYTNIPPELIAFCESERIACQKIPEHNPNCIRIFRDKPPAITSPVNEKTYIVERGEDSKIMLSCIANNDVKKVYWYINDRFLMSENSGKSVFFIPPLGDVKISCSDDKGRNSNIYIRVENH